MPLISVVLPAYNARKFIEQAVQSILDQSFSDFELLVIDDGSTDGTTEILKAITDPRLRLIRHKTNCGLIHVLNEGIAEAKGEFIARMDADDIAEPGRLETQVQFLEKHPQIGIVGSAIRIIDCNGDMGQTYLFPESHVLVEWSMSFFCPIAHPTVMVRASVIRQHGGYSFNAIHAEDYDLWTRMSITTQFANLTTPLLRLRKHEDSVTQTAKQKHLEAAAQVSRRDIERKLGVKVEMSAVRCLCTWGLIERDAAPEACRLLRMLLSQYVRRHGALPYNRIVRRDTAMRLLVIAMRGGKFIDKIKNFTVAHQLCRTVILHLMLRAISRLSGHGQQRLVG